MADVLTAAFWAAAADRAIRSAAQGFLVGAGLGSYAGDFAALSWQAAAHGLTGAVSMAVLSVVFRIAYPPDS